MRQLLRKKSEWKRIEREEEASSEINKMITETPCLAHFAGDRDNVVTTDASRTGLGKILWQKPNKNTIRPIAFTGRYLNDAEKKYSIGELEQLALVCGLENFRFYLYGKAVYLYTNHQTLEPLFKRNRAYLQYNAQLARWLDNFSTL